MILDYYNLLCISTYLYQRLFCILAGCCSLVDSNKTGELTLQLYRVLTNVQVQFRFKYLPSKETIKQGCLPRKEKGVIQYTEYFETAENH